MDVKVDAHSVVISLTNSEARRLCVAIAEGGEGISRSEYFIRTGLSKPAVVDFVNRFFAMLDDVPNSAALSLEAGIEEIENPRRPRPSH